MRKILTVLLGVVLLSSCSVHTSDNVDIDPEDIQYVKDDRTGLCFGIVASRKSYQTDATGLGVTCVPCEKVEKYLKK